MSPVHHPDEEDLLGYASGTSPEWVSLVVACHLTYCPKCRADLDLFDDLGGALLDAGEVTGAEARGVRASDLTARPRPSQTAAPRLPGVPGIPRPLGPYLPEGRPAWRFL